MENNDESWKQNLSLTLDEEEMKLLNNDAEIDDEFIVGLLVCIALHSHLIPPVFLVVL